MMSIEARYGTPYDFNRFDCNNNFHRGVTVREGFHNYKKGGGSDAGQSPTYKLLNYLNIGVGL